MDLPDRLSEAWPDTQTKRRKSPQPDTNQNQRRKHIIKEAQREDECASWAVTLPLLAQYTSHTLDKHTGPPRAVVYYAKEKKKPPLDPSWIELNKYVTFKLRLLLFL